MFIRRKAPPELQSSLTRLMLTWLLDCWPLNILIDVTFFEQTNKCLFAFLRGKYLLDKLNKCSFDLLISGYVHQEIINTASNLWIFELINQNFLNPNLQFLHKPTLTLIKASLLSADTNNSNRLFINFSSFKMPNKNSNPSSLTLGSVNTCYNKCFNLL